MIVFDLAHSGDQHRVAIVGSCRLRTPILSLKPLGKLTPLISQPALTHSFAEGAQNMRHAWGLARVPDLYAPYVFETETSPSPEKYNPAILDGIDTVLVEMCDTRQIRNGEWCFQNNYFARQFVQKRAAELLDWYRAFSKGKDISEDLIQQTLRKLQEAGLGDDVATEDLLRHTRLETPDRDRIIADARMLAADRSKRWIFFSHFSVPDDHGSTMTARRHLAEHVQEAAAAVGAEFFDPTRLITHYGRSRVLRGGGTDIYEYDWDFIPVVGQILLNIVRQGTGSDLELPAIGDAVTEPKSAPAEGHDRLPPTIAPLKEKVSKPVKTETLEQSGDRLNKLLIQLHRDRVKTLGVKNSGLHTQYKSLLDAGQIVRAGDLEVARVVLKELPAFENYVVLKAGVGVVPLLLALAGKSCTAFEASGHRVAAIQASTEALGRTRKDAAARISVETGLVPDTMQKRSTLGIAVGYVSRAAEQEQGRILQLLSRFDALLVEPRTFIRHRSQADLATVSAELAGIGFVHATEVAENLILVSKKAPDRAAA